MIEGIVITEFILPIICLACLCVGYVIKHLIPGNTVDRFIPLIVMCLGILLNIWNFGFVTLEIIVTGAVSGLASTGLYELFSQLIEKGKWFKNDDDDEDDEEPISGKHIYRQ